jgi:hypothetical protein
MVKTVHQCYLYDLGYLLKESAEEARKQAAKTGDPFDQGVAVAYYQVMATLVNEATAFGLPLDELHLAGFDPDSLL